MHERLLEILACPTCKATVELNAGRVEGAHIRAGTLTCTICSQIYPIVRAIPRMVPGETPDEKEHKTTKHFELEFSAHATEDRDLGAQSLLEYLFFTRTGVDPGIYRSMPLGPYPTHVPTGSYLPDGSALSGQRVLDGGCGPGRFLPVAARYAEHVVGLDIGDHIERAYARCQSLSNVDLVQGSVLAPPFKVNTFDYVYTIGVLHHTRSPRAGALALGGLVRGGGSMSIWVYPPEYWGNAPRRLVGKALHKWLRGMDSEASQRIVARWLYPLGRLQERLAQHRAMKVLASPLFVINVPRHPEREVMLSTITDYFVSPIIHTHTPSEVREWLAAAGFPVSVELGIRSGCRGTGKLQGDEPATKGQV